MQPTRASSRLRKNNSMGDLCTGIATKCKPYTLDQSKAMNKKEKACDKDYVTFCMKANNNFRAEFNMATYELFKDKLFTTIDSMSSDQSTLLKYTVDNNTDQKNMVVFQTIKIYHMNKRSMLPNRHASYSVNLYNSTSSLLANGTGINLFIDDIFSPILKCLQQQLDCIDIINADMKCALSNSTSDQSQVKNSRRNSRTEIDNQRMITVGANTSNCDTDTIYNCPLCSKPADLNTIHCDKCLEWVHFECAGLTKSRVDNIPDIAPFTCRLCCDDLLYNTSAMHMANNTEPDSSFAATANTNSELPMIYPPSTSSSIFSAVTHSQPTIIRTDTSEQYILPTSNSDTHTSAQPIIISNDSIGFQTDNLTTSFIAQNVPTSRSALNINSMSTTSNIPTSSSALNINSINLNLCTTSAKGALTRITNSTSPIAVCSVSSPICVLNTHHQVQASRHSSTISTIATSTITSTISPTRPKRRTQTSKVSQENDSLRSFILQLEQKINDQERTINLMKLAKQETHSTNDHSPPKIRHSFQAHDASMHESIIDNNGLRQNLELMEKRLQSLAEYQQVLSFATLNSKIDNLCQAINQQMNTTGNLHHSYYPHGPPLHTQPPMYPQGPPLHVQSPIYPQGPSLHVQPPMYPQGPSLHSQPPFYQQRPPVHVQPSMYPQRPAVHIQPPMYTHGPPLHIQPLMYPHGPHVQLQHSIYQPRPVHPQTGSTLRFVQPHYDNTVQYTVSQGGLQKDTHSDTQTISAQGNVLKPLQPSGRHYVSLPTDTQSHSAATCDVSSAGDIAITRPSHRPIPPTVLSSPLQSHGGNSLAPQSPPIDLAENLPCALNKTINTADIPQCPFLDKGLMEIDKREM